MKRYSIFHVGFPFNLLFLLNVSTYRDAAVYGQTVPESSGNATTPAPPMSPVLMPDLVVATEGPGFCPALHVDFLRRMSEIFDSDVPFTERFDEYDAAGEKHTPFTDVKASEDSISSVTATIKVGVDGNYHPMTPSEDPHVVHWISHVYAVDQDGTIVFMKILTPVTSTTAEVVFDVPPGVTTLTAFAFCNKHGLYQGPTVPVPVKATEKDVTSGSAAPGVCKADNPTKEAWPYLHADFLRRQIEEFGSERPFGPLVEDEKEKEEYRLHIPHIVAVDGDTGTVLVGNDDEALELHHPMTTLSSGKVPHYVTDIYVMDQDGVIVAMQSLDPSAMDVATIEFGIPTDAKELTPYAFFNSEGLWIGPTYILEEEDQAADGKKAVQETYGDTNQKNPPSSMEATSAASEMLSYVTVVSVLGTAVAMSVAGFA